MPHGNKIHVCDKLLIIGGNGFIGQHVVKRALKEKFDVTVLTKNSSKNADILDSVTYVSVDITDRLCLQEKLKGMVFDYVINLGGYVNHVKY